MLLVVLRLSDQHYLTQLVQFTDLCLRWPFVASLVDQTVYDLHTTPSISFIYLLLATFSIHGFSLVQVENKPFQRYVGLSHVTVKTLIVLLQFDFRQHFNFNLKLE